MSGSTASPASPSSSFSASSSFATPSPTAARLSLDRSAVVATLRGAGCVFAEDEAALLLSTASTSDELAVMVARRASGLPLEHVLGWVSFRGLRVAVDERVFVPRRRTEFLVDRAVAILAAGATVGDRARSAVGWVVVDLCCGSGAVGAALAGAVRGPVDLHAADVDPVAVACARRNLTGPARITPAPGRVYTGDLYAPLPPVLRGRVDLLVANVPYVPTGRLGLLPPEARVHEPREALDGGSDGLDVLRRVAAEATDWLAPGGSLLVETSRAQAPLAGETFLHAGLVTTVATCEDLSTTVVAGRHVRGDEA
ncbi:putative protein N(5)-glutamine methyltransferase [Frankia sp. Mgl5]|uniref:putative protein N(5)-glutamine methyltransferase n=1 Tax=Frankia sp. Mgl5 TaxID=2933793 RepID=UPI002034AF0B